MSTKRSYIIPIVIGAAIVALVGSHDAYASGGSHPSTTVTTVASSPAAKSPSLDTVKVTKAYTNANGAGAGELLIKASSSDSSAHLFAYRPDGSLIGEVQNGGGSKYGGTVMPYQFYNPMTVTVKSSTGGTITVATTPFQL